MTTVTEVLKEHGFVDSEYADVFEAMSKILELAAEKLENDEPYAKVTINKLRDVARDIYDMDDFIKDYNLTK